VHVHLLELPLSGRDIALLTTDGVHGVLDLERLERAVTDGARRGLDRLPGDLVTGALDRGSRDNCTAVVAEFLI
jgi:serine/threonine protein phosphatase PrpC